jgi:7-carboxy-7-deazaguanine synthase (Cx14CxxC type)
MGYTVKECFLTLQGEGARAGTAAVFCRFAGCNLWSGLEKDRASAICSFCDTDFRGTDGEGGGKFPDAQSLAQHIYSMWKSSDVSSRCHVVFTGGEPLLQIDEALVEACQTLNMHLAVETNGTKHVPEGIDWICVSPKAGTEISQVSGDELKLVFPQKGLHPNQFEGLPFSHFFLQPMDSPHQQANTESAVKYCLSHPKWRLSLQTHKLIGIP